MALLRLQSISLSSIPHLFTQQIFLPATANSINFACNSQYYIHNTHLCKTHKSSSIFGAKYSSLLAQAAVETPISDDAIEEFNEEEDEEEYKDEASRTRLLAQNVPWSCTASDIRPLFEKYGTVVDVELSMYNKTRNRGLAFVTMGSHEEAVAALTNLESYEYEGRFLKLAWAKPKRKKVPPLPVSPKQVPIHNLFVANLPFQARGKDLMEFFNAENANVVSAEVIFRENPRGSAGYGFISFNTKDEADAVLTNFQGKMFMGRPIRLALSKRFLRQGTKANMQQGDTSNELNSDEEQTKTSMEV